MHVCCWRCLTCSVLQTWLGPFFAEIATLVFFTLTGYVGPAPMCATCAPVLTPAAVPGTSSDPQRTTRTCGFGTKTMTPMSLAWTTTTKKVGRALELVTLK